ncbi:MAG: hypothetical protein K6F77_05970 [Lachnospiraceae bacterium]|nr:hypothetical protein [Lachnospiraceae bacterium]
MYRNNLTNRVFSLFLVLVMTLLLPANHLSSSVAMAADSNKAYIKEIKVFIKTHGDIDDAKEWCASQPENKDKDDDNNWDVIPGNINEGASGALKKEVAVFLCYQKTFDEKEAIRDIALMNEGGNYSVGAYDYMIDQQRDMYTDLVNDMKDMLKEYRANYEKKVPLAVQAHDYLNIYVEDDSGKKLGDLLLDVNDEDLGNILLQSNGQVVIAVQEQLALACDTNKTTWLDRLSKVGSYDNLKEKFIVANNINEKKAIAAMDQKYKAKALTIVNAWDDMHSHIDSVTKFVKDNGLDDMSEKELNDWVNRQLEDESKSDEIKMFLIEKEFIRLLGAYKYGDSSLLNFFYQDVSEVSDDNLYKVYPLAASFTDGQFASLNETVSMYTLLMSAVNSTVMNGNDAGMAAKLDDLSKDDAASLEKDKEKMAEETKDITDAEPVSIYEGVDRDLFKGGVAITSTAENYGNTSGRNWADAFIKNNGFLITNIALGVGSLMSVVGAVVAAKYVANYGQLAIDKAFYTFSSVVHDVPNLKYFMEINNFTKSEITILSDYSVKRFNNYKEVIKNTGLYSAKQQAEMFKEYDLFRDKLFKKGMDAYKGQSEITGVARQARMLEIGLAVFAIILCIVDIVVDVITLCKYYNRDHAPIPKMMVDMTYDENVNKSFVEYKNALSTDGGEGDLNGGGGKQWLAIYTTKDADAGEPILAPNGINSDFILQYKNSKTPVGYSPIHMFGEPNAAQNLTFADGESGWSYNDKKGGIYLFFKKDSGEVSNETATVLTYGKVGIIMVACLFSGFFVGYFVNIGGRRRKKKVAKQ